MIRHTSSLLLGLTIFPGLGLGSARPAVAESSFLARLCFLAAPAPAPAPHYTVTHLGSFAPVGINAVGQVIGTVGQHAFLWEKGTTTELGTLGGAFSGVTALNDAGQVVGGSDTGKRDANGNPIFHAFLWEKGVMKDLGTLGGKSSRAMAINAGGQVIGVADTGMADASGVAISHAFLWSKGVMIDLGAPSGESSVPTTVNEAGQVAGWLATAGEFVHVRGFLWEKGVKTDLGDIMGYPSPPAINAAGQVIFTADTGKLDANGNPIIHAILWAKGVRTDLGTLEGNSSSAIAINEAGQVVGWANTSQAEYFGYADHAFLWEKGAMRDLGTLGGLSSWATGINNAGQVIGWADTPAFYTPAPPPAFPPAFPSPIRRTFLWESGALSDLVSLAGISAPENSDVEPVAINDAGQIIIKDNAEAFLLTPE